MNKKMNSRILCLLFVFTLCVASYNVFAVQINNRNLLPNNCNPPKPNLKCSPDSISWSWIKPGSNISENFTVENINGSGLPISWEIISYPDWGTWQFIPDSIISHRPVDGPIPVEFQVCVPEENFTEFGGEIKVANVNDPNDFCTLKISIKTSKTVEKPSIFDFFSKFSFFNNNFYECNQIIMYVLKYNLCQKDKLGR